VQKESVKTASVQMVSGQRESVQWCQSIRENVGGVVVVFAAVVVIVVEKVR
jgi:hypothetical protein